MQQDAGDVIGAAAFLGMRDERITDRGQFRALSGSFDYDQNNIFVSGLVAVIGAVIVLAIWNAITGHRPLR